MIPATSSFSSVLSRNYCSTSPGGSIRKISMDANLFQGGFLGLDNIGVFNRDQALPNGAYLSQSDGTSWMAMYSLILDANRSRTGAAQHRL